jgi:3-dehydroquinate dehydratase/shikimate dehydrogenase
MSHQYPKTVLCVGKDTVDKVLEELEKINQFAYADIIELRADYIKEEELTEENLAKIKNASDKEILFTLRKQEEGGQRKIPDSVREAFCFTAIKIGFEYIDIENSTPKDMLDRIMSEVKNTGGSTQLILSFHNFNETLESEISEKFNDMKSKHPDIIKIVTMATSEADSNFIIDFVRNNVSDSIRLALFCMGEWGTTNRIQCHNLGSALTYLAVASGTGTASGQLTYDEFVSNPDIQKTIICGLIGKPIRHSMSPLVHNSGYRDQSINYKYILIETDDIDFAIHYIKSNNIRGLSVTMPVKIQAIKYLDDIDPLARKIGSINTIVNAGGKLKGYNTDVVGAIQSIKDVMALNDKKVAMIGAGGAARAIGVGLIEEGAEVIILNRTVEKAERLAGDLKCRFSGIDPAKLKDCDLIINTTSVGMFPRSDETILTELPDKAAIMDIVYYPLETGLLKLAKQNGNTRITGIGMFIYQAAAQYKLFTGKEPPLEVMKKVSLERLSQFGK